MFDVIIVGLGPAGVTAGIYAARKKLRVLAVGGLPGGEVRNSGEIENWPGDGATDGNTLANKLMSHLKAHADMVSIELENITRVEKNGQIFEVMTASGAKHRGRTVIYTAGRHPRLLNVPGETEFKGRGVTYCATCDGPLFGGLPVAVIGGGNSGAEAVVMMQKIAAKIYLLEFTDTLRADPILVANFSKDPKVEIITSAKVTGIEGTAMVEKITYEDLKSKTLKELAVRGVFVAIGATPNTAPVKDLVKLNKMGAIAADRYGATNVPGFFAAGDVTDIRDAQIIVAAGHGCSAALSAGDYLARI